MNYRLGPSIIVPPVALLSLLFASLVIHVRASNDLAAKNPSVDLQLSKISITLACPTGMRAVKGSSCPSGNEFQIPLTAVAVGFAKDSSYSYSVGAGNVVGQGSKVLWDLTGVGPGRYVIKVEVRDSRKQHATSSATVTIAHCADCFYLEPCLFSLEVSCYEKVNVGTPITCKLKTSLSLDPETQRPYTFEWSVRDTDDRDLTATITKRGEYISIPTQDLSNKHVITTVKVKGLEACNGGARGITFVKP